jgi:hypothetical protein
MSQEERDCNTGTGSEPAGSEKKSSTAEGSENTEKREREKRFSLFLLHVL